MKRSDLELLGIAAALLAAALMLSGCKTTSSSESHMAASAAETLDATAHTETHVEEAPSKITTTVEEYANADPTPAADAPAGLRDHAGAAGPRVAVEPSEPPRLVKRTVTVAEIGKKTTDVEADVAAKLREEARLKAEAQKRHTFDFLHGPLALLGGLVALAGVAFAAWKVFKPRLLP